MVLWAYSSVVEPPAHNRLVLGSIPSGPTKLQRLLPRRRTRYSTTQKYDDPIPEIAGRRIFLLLMPLKGPTAAPEASSQAASVRHP